MASSRGKREQLPNPDSGLRSVVLQLCVSSAVHAPRLVHTYVPSATPFTTRAISLSRRHICDRLNRIRICTRDSVYVNSVSAKSCSAFGLSIPIQAIFARNFLTRNKHREKVTDLEIEASS